MILLGILKTAGVLLLVLLLICLLLAFLLLVIPFRYRICGSCSGKVPEGQLQLSWLLKAVHLRLQAKQGGTLTGELKLLGFRYLKIYFDFKTAEDEETKEDTVPEEESAGLQSGPCEMQVQKEAAGKEQENPKQKAEKRRIRRKQYKDRLEAVIHKIWDGLKEKGKHLFDLLKQDYIRLRDSSEGLPGKLHELLTIIGREEYGRSYRLLKKQSLRVIKSVLPRRGTGETEFGFGDPWKTGKVLEVLALLYPLYGSWFEVTPLFEKEYFFCRLDVKGKITLGTIVYGVARIILDRGIRKMYSEIRAAVRGA